MDVLDLFSGIGGFSLGLERAGMRTVAFCEIEPFQRRVLAKHWPGIPIYEDVRTLTADRLRADGIIPDVICGGFPCQDISTAGKGAGIEGERSGLWSHYARLIGEIRPLYVIVENVAALLGRGLDRVLGDLAALGYDAEWHCIPASAVGAPHRRDRIWIVAHPGREHSEWRGVERGKAQGTGPRGGLARSGRNALHVANADENVHQGELVSGRCGGQASSGESPDQCQGAASDGQRLRPEPGASGAVGDAKGIRRRQRRPRGSDPAGAGQPEQALPHPTHYASIREGVRRGDTVGQWWVEPQVGRVAHGVSDRVDSLASLGNAVVPQIPEIIGRAIMSLQPGGK